MQLFDAATGDKLASLGNWSTGSERSGAFSRDWYRFVTNDKQEVRVWDATSCEPLVVIHVPEEGLGSIEGNSVAFSPDGSRIAFTSNGRTVRLCDATSGDELLVLRGHESQVTSITFSPDGSRIW